MKNLFFVTLFFPFFSFAQSDTIFTIAFDVVHKIFFIMPDPNNDNIPELFPVYYTERYRETVQENGNTYSVKFIAFPKTETKKFEQVYKPSLKDSINTFNSDGEVINMEISSQQNIKEVNKFITYYFASPYFHKLSKEGVKYLINKGYCVQNNSDSFVCYTTDSTSDSYNLNTLVHQFIKIRNGVNVYIKTTIYQPGVNNDLTVEYEIERIPFFRNKVFGQKVVIKHYFNMVRTFNEGGLKPEMPPPFAYIPQSNYNKPEQDFNQDLPQVKLSSDSSNILCASDIDLQLKSLGKTYGKMVLNGLGEDED
jgi:hypothetical protein